MNDKELLQAAEAVLKQVLVCPRCKGCQESTKSYFELKEWSDSQERHIAEPKRA